jgi:acetyl esterase/lipase
MTQSLMARLRAMGNEFTLEQIVATRDLYAPLVLRPGEVGASVERDVAYGADPKQKLDVFHAGDAGVQRPVIVFAHGGGFIQGDKGGADSPFFNNFGAWAVKAGFVGVTMTYRLAPAHQWPAGSADVDSVVRWLLANAHRFGGSTQRIVLTGTSAGAIHIAGWFAGHGRASGSVPVAGAALFSGLYQFGRDDNEPKHDAYFGADLKERAAFSTVSTLATLKTPCLFTINENDPPAWHRQIAVLAEACVNATGRCPRLLYLDGHNHVSNLMQLSSPGDTLGEPLARFVRQCTGLET